MRGAIGNLDVAQIVLYAFWLFFFGLVFLLEARRSSRRLSTRERGLASGLQGTRPHLDPEGRRRFVARTAAKCLGSELQGRHTPNQREEDGTVGGRSA